jgi:hypothetical protein
MASCRLSDLALVLPERRKTPALRSTKDTKEENSELPMGTPSHCIPIGRYLVVFLVLLSALGVLLGIPNDGRNNSLSCRVDHRAESFTCFPSFRLDIITQYSY